MPPTCTLLPGADTGFNFLKGGLRPAIRNAGGGGGGGGAFHSRPDTKSGGGGGGGVLSGASGPIQKAGLFSRRGGVAIYEREGCNPQPPTPGSASDCGHFVYHPPTDFRIRYMYSLRGMHLNNHALSIWRSPISCKTC